MDKSRVLVVDDEKNIAFVIGAMLEKAGFEVTAVSDARQVTALLDQHPFESVVTDLMMPGLTGMEILDHCGKHFPGLPVVMITAHGTVESAVSALKKGAFDFVTKPFDQTELLNTVTKAVQTYRRSREEPTLLPEDPEPGHYLPGSSIVGASSQMREVFRVITKVARSPSTVLLRGESGTGKELAAYEIHRLSDRSAKPFIKINCAAIPATLIESELFGYERGAFTGAVTSKPGKFELAHEGTLFLDEVAETPLEMQVKLLRVLQEREFERVGGVHSIRVDTRIITATNRDLEKEVKEGRFREDLFYRLNVVPIQLPPLRDRKEDLVALIGHFLKRFNERLEKNIVRIEPACFAALRSYSWPGNIRQLENVLERMVVMSEGDTLKTEDLPEELRADSEGEADTGGLDPNDLSNFKEIVRRQMSALEKDLIERALDETGGNVTRAAEALGLSRKGLQLKMKELGLKRGE